MCFRPSASFVCDSRAVFPSHQLISSAHHHHHHPSNRSIGLHGGAPTAGGRTPSDRLMRLSCTYQDLDSSFESYERAPPPEIRHGLIHSTEVEYNGGDGGQPCGLEFLSLRFNGDSPDKEDLMVVSDMSARKSHDRLRHSVENHSLLRRSSDGVHPPSANSADQATDATCVFGNSGSQWMVHQSAHQKSLTFSF